MAGKGKKAEATRANKTGILVFGLPLGKLLRGNAEKIARLHGKDTSHCAN